MRSLFSIVRRVGTKIVRKIVPEDRGIVVKRTIGYFETGRVSGTLKGYSGVGACCSSGLNGYELA